MLSFEAVFRIRDILDPDPKHSYLHTGIYCKCLVATGLLDLTFYKLTDELHQ
jgi:hypothetical protein